MFSSTPAYDGVDVEIEGSRQKVIVFGLMVDAVVPDASDVLYTVPPSGEGRLDLLSQYQYGTTELWWVIALVNNIVDPFVGSAVGDVLRIPRKERLSAEGVLGT